MARPSRWPDALRAVAESAFYSPVWVLPVLLIIETLVPGGDSWWARRLHGVRDNPLTAWPVVGMLIVLRPVIAFVVPLALASVGIVFVRHSWAELLGRELVNRIRRRSSADDVGAALIERAKEGNRDVAHLDGVLWLWVFARYEGNPTLERECALRVNRLVTHEALRLRVKVWSLRAWAHLNHVAPHVLPPICGAVIRQR